MFMIINESERNRIKSLYGLITEDAPPSESVLVANKNPFKYTEYETARKPYNSNLKEGEMFYSTVYGKYKEYVESLFQPLYKSFDGKTVRISKDDDIVKIYANTYEPLQMNYEFEKKLGLSKGFISFSYKIGSYNYTTSFSNIDTEYILPYKDSYFLYGTKTEVPGKVVNQSESPEIYKTLMSIGNSMKSEFNKIFSNLSNFPDDVFEIRKIQRQKTDF